MKKKGDAIGELDGQICPDLRFSSRNTSSAFCSSKVSAYISIDWLKVCTQLDAVVPWFMWWQFVKFFFAEYIWILCQVLLWVSQYSLWFLISSWINRPLVFFLPVSLDIHGKQPVLAVKLGVPFQQTLISTVVKMASPFSPVDPWVVTSKPVVA